MEPGQRYFGNRYNDGKTNSVTVMDMENQAMVMFTDDGKQKMAMKIPAGKKTIEKLTKKMEEKNKATAEDAESAGAALISWSPLVLSLPSPCNTMWPKETFWKTTKKYQM